MHVGTRATTVSVTRRKQTSESLATLATKNRQCNHNYARQESTALLQRQPRNIVMIVLPRAVISWSWFQLPTGREEGKASHGARVQAFLPCRNTKAPERTIITRARISVLKSRLCVTGEPIFALLRLLSRAPPGRCPMQSRREHLWVRLSAYL